MLIFHRCGRDCWLFVAVSFESLILQGKSSLHVRKSGFPNSESGEFLAYGPRNLGKLCLRNPKSWALESGIPIMIQVPLTDRLLESSAWNLESTVWNLESRTVLDSLIWGYRVESGAPNLNFWKISVRKTI